MPDTPPTGTAIPRPKPPVPGATVYLGQEPPAPRRSIEEVYRLIDERLPVTIPIEVVTRLSSAPPPAKVEPRPSLAVTAAKRSPRWLSYLITGLVLLAQIVVSTSETERRGPIVQAVKLVAAGISELLAEDPNAPPENVPPEPISPLLPE